MAIQEVKSVIPVTIQEHGYKLDGQIWTKSSDFVPWSQGVIYCAGRNAKMQTLDDAVGFRHDSAGADHSNDYQSTGTLIAVVNDGRAGLRAHVYEPSADELREITLRKEIQEGASYIDLAKNSPLGRRILKFSSDTGRTFVVPSEDLELSVKANKDGDSEYSKHEVTNKLMPLNTHKNATIIAQRGYNTGKAWFYRPELSKGQMRSRPVGLGGVDCNDIDGVDANVDFYYGGGRARGLVHGEQKISSGNNGRCVAKSRK